MLGFQLGYFTRWFWFFRVITDLNKKMEKCCSDQKKCNILETSEVIKNSPRQFLALHVLAFVTYCQNPEIFIYLCSVNYHALIIYKNLYQFNLLIQRTKRSSLWCAFIQVEQKKKKKDAKGRIEKNYFSSSQMLSENWKEYKKRENQAMGWLLLRKVFGGRNLTWKQLLFPDGISGLLHSWFPCQQFQCAWEAQTKIGEGEV